MIVIANSDAGRRGGANTTARLAELFAAVGASPRIVEPDGSRDISALAREAAQSSHEIVVAAGGDGTISTVAAALVGTGKTLGVLPIGTLNHFAKDLGIPLDLPAAVRNIAAAHPVGVDVAEVNGRVFINNSSLGLYPRIVAKRQAQQERLARGKWPAFLWATIHAFHRFPFLNLRITTDQQQLERKTAFLFVGNNEYEIAGFRVGGRACLNRGNLGLYLTHRTGRLGLFRLAFRALLGRLDQAADFDAFCVEQAFIESGRRRLLVATDGEVGWMQTPLHYRTRPGALKVFVPESPA